MDDAAGTRFTGFAGSRRIASGTLENVALRLKETIDSGATVPTLIFDDVTGRRIDVELGGAVEDVRRRLAERAAQERQKAADPPPRSRGRPRLGVVGREVTLLPRHWAWLNEQPGGASVALRKLVDQARRANAGRDRIRRSQEAAYRFMVAMAGDRPGFEEATRALFAADRERFDALTEPWPADIRDHARLLAAAALERPPPPETG